MVANLLSVSGALGVKLKGTMKPTPTYKHALERKSCRRGVIPITASREEFRYEGRPYTVGAW